MRCRPGYTEVLVESFRSHEWGHRNPVGIRPVPGQPFPTHLQVECAEAMRTKYPVGTVFRVCVRLKQKRVSRPHLYSSWQWPFEVVRLGAET